MPDFTFQFSPKLPNGDLINIRADDSESFDLALTDYAEGGLVEKVINASVATIKKWNAITESEGLQVAVAKLGATVQSVAPAAGGAVSPSQPAVGGAQGQGNPGQVYSDKWQRQFEYGLPNAPATPRGPAVKLTANKKDNSGTYSKWIDPASGPVWFEQRLPKKDSLSDLFVEQWVR